MTRLIKPPKLSPGDKIATVSPSWGCAGDPAVRWRYDLGVSRLESEFGLTVVPMPHSLKGGEYLKTRPEARAEDLMTAFADPAIKGIISNIGGNDSVRLLPYIDSNVIHNNPKVFIGYSDIINIHLLCFKAGLSTFYGANLLTTIADPQGFSPYVKTRLHQALFETRPIGNITSPSGFTCDETEYENSKQIRKYHTDAGIVRLQGSGKITGRLFGGDIWLMEPEKAGLIEPLYQDGVILFFEDIVECVKPRDLMIFLRWLGAKNILNRLNGIVFGRFNEYPENTGYRDEILQVIGAEYGLRDMPILYNLPFGHTYPICVLPFGALAEIDCDNAAFSVLESGVV